MDRRRRKICRLVPEDNDDLITDRLQWRGLSKTRVRATRVLDQYPGIDKARYGLIQNLLL